MGEKDKKKTSNNYEEAIKELKCIVDKLNSGQIDLNDALDKFKKGNEIIKFCEEELKKTETQIETIINKNKK